MRRRKSIRSQYKCVGAQTLAFHLYTYLTVLFLQWEDERLGELEMRDELMINKRPTGINWTTAIFMGILHIGA
ncbi:MAG TPA: hypothetical protein VFM05_02755, partial [Candidatus Saccharimonadales bacterium]|nr:hypothetical protein [Candidatus Saccharimonadales bacterium]